MKFKTGQLLTTREVHHHMSKSAEFAQFINRSIIVRMLKRPTTKCFCNGAVTGWFKVLSSFNVFVSWDRTRLRKGTTAETQTLGARRDRISDNEMSDL